MKFERRMADWLTKAENFVKANDELVFIGGCLAVAIFVAVLLYS